MKIATPIIAFLGVPGLALAQSEIRIPTDAGTCNEWSVEA